MNVPNPYVLQSESGVATFLSGNLLLRIGFPSAQIARITLTEGRPSVEVPSRIVLQSDVQVGYTLKEEPDAFTLSTDALTIKLNKATGALRYFDPSGKILMQEPERGGKWLTQKPLTRNIFERNAETEISHSIDGARARATNYQTIFDHDVFEAKLEFVFGEDEALFGLGSHEEGYGNLRGHSRELYQQNMKAVVPHLVSTRGYGLLLDCYSLMVFRDDVLGSYWWADVVDQLDFYFIFGGDFDGVMRGYRDLTGPTPLPPKWAFGFVQSKERYVNAAELIEVVREYRRRDIPLDIVVLDWKSWPNGPCWGQKSFDPLRFPDPLALTSALHALGAKLMVSIWPIMMGDSENQRELLDRNLMLGNQATYNAFDPHGRELYWDQVQRGLFSQGVDAWWCDCTEPFEADWVGAVKPEQHARLRVNTEASALYLGASNINAYSLMHSKGIYEGQRKTTSEKRVLNLTRSSYAGQHRYGTVTWNGDINGTWETFRRCIPEGLNFAATGEAYWTVDAGGFFLDNDPRLWFWRGEYSTGCRGLTDMNALTPDASDTGCKDLGFWELYVRWLQYAAFLPMFRSHGTDAAREIWRFGEEGSPFYEAIADTIRLRYRFMPYIYSLAAAVTASGSSMVRALALEFPNDRFTHDLTDQFLFGKSIMVCPVIRPMLYNRDSRPIENAPESRYVYLPAGSGWFNFWTGVYYTGGQTLLVEAPLRTIPLFVAAGSILPMSLAMPYTDAVPDAPIDLRIYTGADAHFTLYEDAGDTYNYEQGQFAEVQIDWEERSRQLMIGRRNGTFSTLVSERTFDLSFYSAAGVKHRTIRYTGLSHLIIIPPKEDID